jgi:hypothetical protein
MKVFVEHVKGPGLASLRSSQRQSLGNVSRIASPRATSMMGQRTRAGSGGLYLGHAFFRRCCDPLELSLISVYVCVCVVCTCVFCLCVS